MLLIEKQKCSQDLMCPKVILALLQPGEQNPPQRAGANMESKILFSVGAAGRHSSKI